MSVKTELLVEKINKMRDKMKEVEEDGEDSLSMSRELNRLVTELKNLQKKEVLNDTNIREGATLLKG